MDKITKALKKLRPEERDRIKAILKKIQNKQLENLDLQKLKGRDAVYRVRKGKLRIIYRINFDGSIFIVAIERRSDNTYNK